MTTPESRAGIIIFDLDGCIADDSRRLQLIDTSATGALKYVKYHADLIRDPVLAEGRKYIKDAVDHNMFIAFVTARPESLAKETASWIESELGLRPGVDYALHMRAGGDLRSSPDFKADAAVQIQQFATNNGTRIVGAFDDRQDVVQAYKAIGILAWVLNADGSDAPFLQTLAAPGVAGPQTNQDIEDAVLVEDPTAIPEFIPPSAQRVTADQILANMASMFKAKNAVYADNSEVVGRVLKAFFPNGVELNSQKDHEFWHLFNLVIVKLTRFTQTGLRHQDSIHDGAIYMAMCELLVSDHSITIK